MRSFPSRALRSIGLLLSVTVACGGLLILLTACGGQGARQSAETPAPRPAPGTSEITSDEIASGTVPGGERRVQG
jgi:hypothetical protein